MIIPIAIDYPTQVVARERQGLAPIASTLPVLAVLLAYGWTVRAWFLADDFGYVSRFAALPFASWPNLFIADWSGGIWGMPLNELRPVSALAFMLDARLWGVNAGGYHLTNVALHLACSLLVLCIARVVIPRRWMAASAAAVMFALHPANQEAVVWVTGRVDLIAALGLLVGVYGFLRFRTSPVDRWLMVAWSGYTVGIFAKESALILPIVALMLDRLDLPSAAHGSRRAVTPYVGWAAIAFAYLACRLAAGSSLNAEPVPWDLRPERFAAYASAMVAAPASVYWLRRVLELSSIAHALLPMVIALLIVVAIALVARPSLLPSPMLRMAASFGFVWPMLCTVPLIVTYFSLRHLYIATAGFAIAAAALLAYLFESRRGFLIAAGLVVAAFVAQLWPGLASWRLASERSRNISEAVARVASTAEQGEVLLLDVASPVERQWLWDWASPFALSPPFQEPGVAQRLVVLERPAVYRDPGAWPDPQTRARLEQFKGSGWVVALGSGASASIARVPADALARALDDDWLRSTHPPDRSQESRSRRDDVFTEMLGRLPPSTP